MIFLSRYNTVSHIEMCLNNRRANKKDQRKKIREMEIERNLKAKLTKLGYKYLAKNRKTNFNIYNERLKNRDIN